MNKVFALVQNNGCIAAVNSDAFLTDTTGWTELDAGEGDGDRYMHAQGNYLPKPLVDEQGRYRYKLVDGAVVERTAEELTADELPVSIPTPEERNRADIDYLAMIGGVDL